MLFDFANIDLNEKGELYHTLYQKIIDAITLGAIKTGEKLPSVREAAAVLQVSRTTVENAYTKLCIEGVAESVPKVGYFICENKRMTVTEQKQTEENEKIYKYDFSSRKIDVSSADTEIWKRLVRSVLWDSEKLASYGEKQGEFVLRNALSSYSYKARGVNAKPQNIVIGAGMGTLLNLLCTLLGRRVKIGIENGGFREAQGIFSDYGIETVLLESDQNGATMKSIEKENIDILFLLPSALSKISVNSLNKRRNEYSRWVKAKPNRYIIEDDYNGELRYTARTVSSFQGRFSEKTVYIGSFSKLLLPSVRIAYMVLPDSLKKILDAKAYGINQTCGKIEQLALSEYILKGHLEKHLRRLRRIYYNKSQILIRSLCDNFEDSQITLYESSLAVVLRTNLPYNSTRLCKMAEDFGIRVEESENIGEVKLFFAFIDELKIPEACAVLKKAYSKKH